jgi:hypothetical protein
MMTIHKSHHGWARRMDRLNIYKFAKANIKAEYPSICGKVLKKKKHSTRDNDISHPTLGHILAPQDESH